MTIGTLYQAILFISFSFFLKKEKFKKTIIGHHPSWR